MTLLGSPELPLLTVAPSQKQMHGKNYGTFCMKDLRAGETLGTNPGNGEDHPQKILEMLRRHLDLLEDVWDDGTLIYFDFDWVT